MLKGENYASQLYENWSNRLAFNTLLGGNCGIIAGFDNDMEVTASGTDISVDSGVVIIKGGIIRNTTSATLSVQLEANQYCSVVLEIDLSQTNTNDSFNQGSLKILTQTGAYPTLTQQDIVNNTTSGIYQYELARFKTTTTEIQDLTDKRTYLDYASLTQELVDAIEAVIQGNLEASDVGYNNTNSSLDAENVQDAIDEIVPKVYTSAGSATGSTTSYVTKEICRSPALPKGRYLVIFGVDSTVSSNTDLIIASLTGIANITVRNGLSNYRGTMQSGGGLTGYQYVEATADNAVIALDGSVKSTFTLRGQMIALRVK